MVRPVAGLLLWMAASFSVVAAGQAQVGNEGIAPDGALAVEVSADSVEEFFDSLETYAKENAFETRISGAPPAVPIYLMQLVRPGVRILVRNVGPGIFRVGVYRYGEGASEVSPETAAALFEELKDRLENAAGWRVTDIR
jgi:hypothetical protein